MLAQGHTLRWEQRVERNWISKAYILSLLSLLLCPFPFLLLLLFHFPPFSFFSPFFHYRLPILWDEEVERVGPEKASLGRVVWTFQKTRVLMDIVANILCIIMAAIGLVSGGGLSSALSPTSPYWPRMSLVTFSTSWWVYTLSLSLSSLGANFHKANPCQAQQQSLKLIKKFAS